MQHKIPIMILILLVLIEPLVEMKRVALNSKDKTKIKIASKEAKKESVELKSSRSDGLSGIFSLGVEDGLILLLNAVIFGVAAAGCGLVICRRLFSASASISERTARVIKILSQQVEKNVISSDAQCSLTNEQKKTILDFMRHSFITVDYTSDFERTSPTRSFDFKVMDFVKTSQIHYEFKAKASDRDYGLCIINGVLIFQRYMAKIVFEKEHKQSSGHCPCGRSDLLFYEGFINGGFSQGKWSYLGHTHQSKHCGSYVMRKSKSRFNDSQTLGVWKA